MSLFDAQENAWADYILNDGSAPSAATHMGLATALAEDGTITEVSGGSYARLALTASEWDPASGGVKQNNTDITFAQATADWATGATYITHVVFYTASTGGTPIAYMTLTTPLQVADTQQLNFASGQLRLTVS